MGNFSKEGDLCGWNLVRRLLDGQHAFEGDQRPAGDIFFDMDLIDEGSLDDVFKAPAKVCKIDSVHRSAHANQGREKMDLLLGVLFFEAVDQVQFGTDGPFGTWGSFLDRFDDFAGRSRDVCDVVDFLGAFGVDEDFDAGDFFSKLIHVGSLEHLVDRAVSFPEDHFRFLDGLASIASEFFFVGVPNGHVLVGDPHFEGRVSSEVLVREKEDPFALGKRPIQDCFGVA